MEREEEEEEEKKKQRKQKAAMEFYFRYSNIKKPGKLKHEMLVLFDRQAPCQEVEQAFGVCDGGGGGEGGGEEQEEGGGGGQLHEVVKVRGPGEYYMVGECKKSRYKIGRATMIRILPGHLVPVAQGFIEL